jgi:hypothetical protein
MGLSKEESETMINQKIKEALKDFRRKSKLEVGMDAVIKIRDQFMSRVTEGDEILVKQEVEINDYKDLRDELSEKDFLDSLYDLTSCNVYV